MLAGNPRALAMLNLAAEKSGWGQPLPARSGRGISLHQAFGSFCALVLEVEVSPQGDIRMNKAIAAIDCGYTVNPDTVVAQIEGGTIFGLSAALYSGIEFDRGRTVQSNFHDYRILRIDEAPKLEVYRAENTEKPGGIGEVGSGVCGPGPRQRHLCRHRRSGCAACSYDRMQLMSQGADKHVVGNLAPIGGAGLALLAQTASADRKRAVSVGREKAYEPIPLLRLATPIVAGMMFAVSATLAVAQNTADPRLVARGQYLTQAADCQASSHRTRRPALHRRPRFQVALRRDLFAEHHARQGHRHRQLERRRFRSRSAPGHRQGR